MQVPLVIIVGFLGAGKTTLLQRIIPVLGKAGIKPRVVLNDYADATVDAARLAAMDALVSPISGDCICCGSREELFRTLTDMTLEPQNVVLIEANGTSDATELHDMLALDQRLSAFTLPIQLTVVDVKRWQKRFWHNALEREQAATASHFWLNWAERVKPERLDTVAASLSSINAAATTTSAEDFASEIARLSVEVAADPSRDRTVYAGAARAATDHEATHHRFASLGCELPPLVSRAALTKFIVAIAPQLQRAKGVACFSEEPDRQYVWNFLGGDKDLRYDRLPSNGFRTVAVFIGAGLPHEEIRERVKELQQS